MRLTVRAGSILEQFGLWLGLVPVPLFETHIAATLARSIMAGVELGVFECLQGGPRDAPDIARRCHTDLRATTLLVNALVASRYLRSSPRGYELTSRSRRWLLRDSPSSIRDKILLQSHEWDWLARLEDFSRTGVPLDFHKKMSDAERLLYHRSMRAIAGIAGREVAWRTPVPRGARRMLDLGGSHGHFAASLCRRYPQMSADVLDLPDAVAITAPILAREGLGARVVHVAGDALQSDLGSQRYDLVLMSNLAHHFTQQQNQDVALRVARALRTGGVFVLQEAVTPKDVGKAGQLGALLGLYFALQSGAGTRSWSADDLREWQLKAALAPHAPTPLLTAPGWIQQSASRP
jgi:SAM-dependent methyltransferase